MSITIKIGGINMETYKLELNEKISVTVSTQKVRDVKIFGMIFKWLPIFILIGGVYNVFVDFINGNVWAPPKIIIYIIFAVVFYGISKLNLNFYELTPLNINGPKIYIRAPITSFGSDNNPLIIQMHLSDLEKINVVKEE